MKRNKSGQTVIEFALVFIIFLFMLSLTFNAVLAFCTQQYLSYATFMAARAYQAADSDEAAQSANALLTLQGYIPNLPTSVSTTMNIPLYLGTFAKPLATITGVSVPQGALYGPAGGNAHANFAIRFTVPFVQVPIGGGLTQQFGTIQLSTLSYLGREVTKSECRSYFSAFINRYLVNDGTGNPVTFMNRYGPNMEDNGC